jgi:hypothetical protein
MRAERIWPWPTKDGRANKWWADRENVARSESGLILFLAVAIACAELIFGLYFAFTAHGVWRAAMIAVVPGLVMLLRGAWSAIRVLTGVAPRESSADGWPLLVYGSFVLLMGGVICAIVRGLS